jgi:hypothetical protein
MSALVPVFAWRSANAFPAPSNGVAVELLTMGQALGRRWPTDAHVAGYSTEVPRRLNNAAIGKVAISMSHLIADLDDPIAHRLGIPARDEWRESEEQKIEKLLARHPRAVVYGTTGGMRLIFECAPFPIAKPEDSRVWWEIYGSFVRYLRREFGIIADARCKDFGRLFRLPCVRRDGVQIEGPLTGDPHHIERLNVSKLPTLKSVHPFVLAAKKAAIKNVRAAVNGQRNEVLNKEAFSLGGFIASGHLDEVEVTDALLDAIVENGGDIEGDSAKIVAAIEAGKLQPREPPPSKPPPSGTGTSLSGASRAKRVPAAGAAAPETGRPAQQSERNDAPEPEDTGDGRRVIRIHADIYKMTTQASVALRDDPMIFQRNDQLVRVTSVTRDEVERSRTVETDDGPRRELVEGTPRIRVVEFPTLKERLCVVADFRKYDGRREPNPWVAARPDGDVVSALLARGEWPGIRHLRGIAEAPTVRPDGSILQGEPRHDAATGLLYAPNAKFPIVPERPTKADARRAYAMLVDLLADFPHEDDERDEKGNLKKAGAHKAVPIAHALTIVARAAIVASGIPLFLYDANTRGSGKTLQTDLVAMIATGRPMPRMTYPHSDEELEKVLAGYALRGATLLCFDNVTRQLGGGPLDKVLTARDLVDLRVLGLNEIPTLVWLAVIAATGNNVQFQADIARRVISGRLESLEVRPEAKTDFKRPDLLDHVARNRPSIVVALLTILRAYFVAGCPDMGCGTSGSFEGWARLIPPAIVYAGGGNVMKARAEADANPEEDSFAAFLGGMWRHLKAETFTAAGVREWLYPSDPTRVRPTDLVASDVREAVETLCGRAPVSAIMSALGVKLRRYRDRVFEIGKQRLRLVKAGEHAKTNRWAIEEFRRA